MITTSPLRSTLLSLTVLTLLLSPARLWSQSSPAFAVDSDHDGLSDTLEQHLLEQFAPTFMVGQHDCSVIPAEFTPGLLVPQVLHDNGTIYGQAFLAPGTGDHATLAELHFYHLWRKDCGGHGHPLDTEHVAVLVQASDTHLHTATWHALYWYAAAHENTVCDVSQIARASTLAAVDHGATVWISPGKHASYLNPALCRRGCGADRCEDMVALTPTRLINLGEPQHPMNGSTFIASSAWPLLAKMSATNFPAAPLTRLAALPDTDIAWFNPGRHPAQGIIAHSSSTEAVLASGDRNTVTALSLAGASTGSALSTTEASTAGALGTAGASTGNALDHTLQNTRKALSTSTRHVGKALHLTANPSPTTPR